MKKDHFFTGLISGILSPAIAFAVYSKIKLPDVSLLNVMHHIRELGISATIISLSTFINLLVFFIFIWTKNDHSAKGVLAATFGYAFVVVILKFVL
ncbi:MAG: hypothetical protein NT126_10085 [Bacteroidetes bacterium]|nr:hypothetical protein [Bacteroidota bacterium]